MIKMCIKIEEKSTSDSESVINKADIPVPIICQGAVEEVGDQTESVIGGSIPVQMFFKFLRIVLVSK
jgi:hypothetical protein